jgi:hypothetical protein
MPFVFKFQVPSPLCRAVADGHLDKSDMYVSTPDVHYTAYSSTAHMLHIGTNSAELGADALALPTMLV